MDANTNTPATATTAAQQSSSSSTETNKKRNYHRRRNNNNKKSNADNNNNNTTDASSSTTTTTTTAADNNNNKKKKKTTDNKKKSEPIEKVTKEPLKGFKKVSKEESEEADEEEEDAEVCFICTRPIDYYAVAPCDHRTCHLCTLRLRVLYNTKNCAYCKAEAKRVVFTMDGEKPYESYSREDTPFYDKKYGIRFETEAMYKETMVLLQHNCPEQDCERAFEHQKELKDHVKETHHRLLCDFCIRNKKIFSHEHTLYTRDQLQKHYREGDASFNKDDETGFTGHPDCVFCKTRFYGADELFEHCRDKHEQCHLCVRRGIQHQYYANYDNLEKHFKKEHFLCMYKECLDNKFVVFDSDIDLKAHEVKEHGNALSRQQRAKQSELRRVDVNLSYTNNQRNGNRQQQQQQQQPISLSAEDFPDINGSTTAPLLSSRVASIQLSEQDQWPTLGDDTSAAASSGRSSPSANESDTGIVSRHAAALDRIADIFKKFDKVVKFRQLTSGFTSLSTDAETFVNAVYDLCGQDADLTAKVLNGAKDLVDNRTLKSEMVRSWNQKKNPSNGTDTPRVLVVNPSSSSARRAVNGHSSNKKAGVWDKVASAAVDAGAPTIRSSTVFPPIQSKTPWSGTSTPRTASESDLQQLFPALPYTGPSRRADINSMIKKKNINAWGGESTASNATAATTDSESSDLDTTNRKKKGKKGKQILFRVGL